MIDRFEPPAAGADVDLFDEIEEQLAGPSLSAEERDEILDTELPRDVENRQEVYRPAFKDSGQRWATCLLIYSGLVKNLERSEERRVGKEGVRTCRSRGSAVQ